MKRISRHKKERDLEDLVGKNVYHDIQTSPVCVIVCCVTMKKFFVLFFLWDVLCYGEKDILLWRAMRWAKNIGISRALLKVRENRVVEVLKKLALSVQVTLYWTQMIVLAQNGLYSECTRSERKFQCAQVITIADHDQEWSGGAKRPENIPNLLAWDADM